MQRNAETHQTVLWGMGENHIEITLERLKRKYGVEVNQVPLPLPYKETFKGPVKAWGRHVSSPAATASTRSATSRSSRSPVAAASSTPPTRSTAGPCPTSSSPSVEKGVRKAMEDGLAAGLPGGRHPGHPVRRQFHSVDSSDMAFQIAGGLAMKEAAAQADMVLLEPVLELEALVPDEFVGDILATWSAWRGRGRDRPRRHRQDAAGPGDRPRGRGGPLRHRPALDDQGQGLVCAEVLPLYE